MSYPDLDKLCRWVPPEERSRSVEMAHERVMADIPLLSVAGESIVGTGKDKIVLLHKAVEKVNNGEFPISRQTIGDCVSHGFAGAIQATQAVEIAEHGDREKWMLIATEWLYGTGRVLVGGGRLGNRDGSIGSWQAKAIKEHGTLHRVQYPDVDLSRYSGQRAKSWGYRGLPYDLEETADQWPVGQTAVVSTWEELRDAVANGYAVAICSSQGFRKTRDNDGFARPSGIWHHCMYCVAIDDKHRRPGGLIVNSWGKNWISGPKRHDQPDGSFWADADVLNAMLRGRDSFAVADYQGFRRKEIEWSLF